MQRLVEVETVSFEEDKNEYNNRQIRKRRFDYREINNPSVKSAYLLWYPLIAACSFYSREHQLQQQRQVLAKGDLPVPGVLHFIDEAVGLLRADCRLDFEALRDVGPERYLSREKYLRLQKASRVLLDDVQFHLGVPA